SVQPCDDFYQYVCGPWMAANPIPPDQATWSRFDELREHNRSVLRDILEQASANNRSRLPVEREIGDFYASCMDESAIDSKGIAALKPEIDRIDALASKSALVEQVAHLHSLGVHVLFQFDSTQDFKNSSEVIAEADQGGLGLPERDYYFKQDAKSVEIREKYVAHVQKMFELLGRPPQQAAAAAKVVMQIETALAKGSLDRVSRRDPAKLYHRWPEQRLTSLTPSFAWPKYLEGVHAPAIQDVNVAVPDFFQEMQALIDATSLDNWKAYLTWHLVHEEAPLLPAAFVSEDFNFFSKTLRGAKELRPRWKRCVDFTDAELGEALGQEYVKRAFPPEAKQRTLKTVHELEIALGRDISQLDWMTPATKKQALLKLHAIANKIGYPDKWRDYSSVRIVRGDALGNIMRADAFEFHRQLEKIGKPVNRSEWLMTPSTVNAYYDAQMNNVNFPAGILQPPFFYSKADDAVNFGGIGAVIGHELTHGFDDEGRQFDAQGNLRDWWTLQDGKEFEKRAACVADEYSQFTPVDDARINGKLTLGENTADNGGLRIAYMALLSSLAGKEPARIDGFTPEQRLFLNWGAVWCTNMTDQYARLMVNTNPHSPGRFRVNGVVSNMPEFQKAFACKAGQPMAPKNRCHVW
ncbi:MAG TPA: M13 family metallopeptidase, partial [Bryobacterales bacterium]|nr:M13 family metallopeptidase [Bryobacterales bacterium]